MQIYNVEASGTNSSLLESVHQIMGLIEQIEVICTDLIELEAVIPVKYKAEVGAIKSRAETVLRVVTEDVNEEELLHLVKDKIAHQGTKSKIERLGVQELVIRLRSQGKTYVEISEQIGVSPSAISQFCKVYDRLSPREQLKTRSRSIMDFTGHWEEMGILIYRMLSRLENDPENHVKYISELRQLLKNVEAFQSRYTAQQELNQIKQVIQEILIQELPEKRQQIMQRFKEAGVNKMLPG